MESVFAALKRQELAVSPQLMDTLHHAIDNLNQLMPALERDRTSEEKAKASATVRAVESIIKKTVVIPPAQKSAEARAVEPTTPGTEVSCDGGPISANAERTWYSNNDVTGSNGGRVSTDI